MSISETPKPVDRLADLEVQIRRAKQDLAEHQSRDWAPDIGDMLEGLSHEIGDLEGDKTCTGEDFDHRCTELETRMGDIKTRIASGEQDEVG